MTGSGGGILSMGGFVIASLLVLFVPGPTNTLLATRGALLGFRRALGGVLAEMIGYAVAILALRLILEPITAHVPAARIFLQATCACYLIFVSYRLWTGAQKGDPDGVSLRRIFVATLSNPKAFLFAFVILPAPVADIMRTNAMNGLILLGLIALAGTVWTMVGALAVARATSNWTRTIGRTASLILAGFGLTIFISACSAASALGA